MLGQQETYFDHIETYNLKSWTVLILYLSCQCSCNLFCFRHNAGAGVLQTTAKAQSKVNCFWFQVADEPWCPLTPRPKSSFHFTANNLKAWFWQLLSKSDYPKVPSSQSINLDEGLKTVRNCLWHIHSCSNVEAPSDFHSGSGGIDSNILRSRAVRFECIAIECNQFNISKDRLNSLLNHQIMFSCLNNIGSQPLTVLYPYEFRSHCLGLKCNTSPNLG
jgi:hypothetical protein